MSNKLRSKALVVRITGLPIWTTIEKLKAALVRFPNEETTFAITDTTMCLSCYNDQTRIAITQFSPYCPEVLVQLSNGSNFVTQFEGCDIRIDKDFYGLTPLYATEGPINADIVALSGLDGHAYGSWRAKTDARRMWLRDFLPQDFPNCRAMTYGYNSKLQCHATHTILDFTRGLLEELVKARESEAEMKRPIVFIGHSFGGIIIVQSLVRAKERTDDHPSRSLLSATYATIFFGTPHRGLIIDDINAMLGDDSPRKPLLDSIKESSEALKVELSKFADYSKGIKIVSFYETKQTRKLKKEDGKWSRSGEYFTAVETESAILQLPDQIEETLPAEGDHSDMVKLCHRGDSVYTSILSHLKDFRPNNSEKERDTVCSKATYLTHYMGRQSADALRRLLESGSSDANESYRGTTCLHQAVAQEDEETVSILLQYKVDLEIVDDKHQTALHIAASTGNATLVGMLLKKGARIHKTALQSAVAQGHAKVVKLLFEYGAEAPEVGPGEKTLLHIAAAGGYYEVLELLLKRKGVDINSIAHDKNTALHSAAGNGHLKAVEVLLENGADISIEGPEKRTSLEISAAAGHDQVVSLLLPKYDKKKNNPLFKSALHVAAANGHAKVVGWLLKNVPGILVRTGNMTVLQIAARKGHAGVVEALLEGGADTEEEMYETGQTALYLARTAEIVELLLNKGANITADDGMKTNRFGKLVKGFTKLHDAASWGQIEIVKVLLQHGVDINLRDSDSHTATFYACVNSRWHTYDYLQRHGGVTTLATTDSRCVIN